MQSKVVNLNENSDRQKRNIRALLEKFLEVTLISGLPVKYDTAFQHTKKENRIFYSIESTNVESIAQFVHEIPNKKKNYHVSLGPIKILNDPTPEETKVLAIIDLDVNHEDSTIDGISNFKKRLSHLFSSYPNTFSIRTKSGGLHLYYYTTVEFIREINAPKIVSLIDGVDFLSSTIDPNKMYSIIGPGSYTTHESFLAKQKSRYSIETNAPIRALPDSFKDFLRKYQETSQKWQSEELAKIKKIRHNGINEDDPFNINAAQAYVNELVVEAAEHYRNNGQCKYEGKRNDSLNRFSFHLATFGLSETTFTNLASQINTLVFRDPLSDEEFSSTINSAMEARQRSGESYLNAEIDIPDFDPYPHSNITHQEFIERAKHIYTIKENQIANSHKGVKLLAYTTLYAHGLPINGELTPIDKVLEQFQYRLEDKTLFTYANLSSEIRSLELRFIHHRSEKLFNDDIGPIDIPQEKKRGRPKDGVLTNHPLFRVAVRRGLRLTYDRPDKYIVKNNNLYVIPPEPLSMLPSISDADYQKQLPFIKEILEHFKQTITNPGDPREFEYIQNFIAALCQNKQVQAFIVLYGPQGTGKSQFLKFISLFVPSEDWTGAKNPNAVFERFANVGSLTTIDDCNLNTTKELDSLKSRVSDDLHSLERKYKDEIKIKKHISIVAATNHKLTDPEFLNERRLVWFESAARYTGPEYASIVDSQCRRLISNGALGLAALYRYFKEFKITISDWNFRSRSHLALIREVNSQIQTSSETNKWKLARAINQENNAQRRKEEIAVINLIANFGYIKESKIHVPFCTPYEELIEYNDFDEFPKTAPDWMFIFMYYHSLNETPIKKDNFIGRILKHDKKLVKGIANFVREMNGRHRALAEVTEGCFSPVDKKVKPNLLYHKSMTQKRIMVLPPINDWLRRISILANGSVSTEVSYQLLDSYGLMPIINFFQDKLEEPKREECEHLFSTLFPGEIMGEYNVIADGETNLDLFDNEEVDEESSDFEEKDVK